MTRRKVHGHDSLSILQKGVVYAVVACLCVYLSFVLVRTIMASALLDKRDRINVVFYGKETVLLSLGLADNVNYIISFDNEDRVSVPGGYGRYRVGALGKLADLERDPELLSRTFSSMISAYVDYYVYQPNKDVFEGEDLEDTPFTSRLFVQRLFSSSDKTNAGIVDRMYLAYVLSKYRSQDFVSLRGMSQINDEKETDYSEKRFLKKYKGFFYHKSLRDEAKEVKLLYTTSYNAAEVVSRVIEGEGIRVVDLSEVATSAQQCKVTYSSFGESKTARYLSRRFGCDLVTGETEGSDIIVSLGEELTEVWK